MSSTVTTEGKAALESGPKRLEHPKGHVLYRYLRMVDAPMDIRPVGPTEARSLSVDLAFALDGRMHRGYGVAHCHPDDKTDHRLGRMLATRRAISDAWENLPQERRDRIVRAMPEYKAAKAKRKEERDARKRGVDFGTPLELVESASKEIDGLVFSALKAWDAAPDEVELVYGVEGGTTVCYVRRRQSGDEA